MSFRKSKNARPANDSQGEISVHFYYYHFYAEIELGIPLSSRNMLPGR